MNKRALRSVMALNGDTCKTLAEFLQIARNTFSAKLNQTHGAEFTQNEIAAIKNRYNLTPGQVDSIFFGQKPS